MRSAIALLLGAIAAVAAAATVSGQDAAAATPPPPFALRTGAQWIGAAVFVDPADSRLNPDNRTLRLAQTTWLTELRVNARLEAGSRWQAVVRPRVSGSVETIRVGEDFRAQRNDAALELTEAYVNWQPSDAISFTYGLQNFQWGPAEMMSPSNRLFHEIGVFRDVLYSVRGKHLARVNVSAGRQWSFVALAEPAGTDEEPFRADEKFRRAAQAKLEYTTRSGAAYVGLTAGTRRGEPPWTGAYISVALNDGLSAYFDASLQRGSQAWYPVVSDNGTISFSADSRSGGARVLALAGLRYTFSSAFDARVEFLHQDAGYDRAQVMNAAIAVEQHPSRETVDRWIRPGLEFLGRDVVLGSVLALDLPPDGRLDLHCRYVRSLTDGSGSGFATASLDATDAVAVFASLTLTHGPEPGEFTRLADAGLAAGFIWSW